MVMELSGEEVLRKVSVSMEMFDELPFLSQYGMYMGKAQMIEFGLKKVLVDEKGYDLDTLKNSRLGWTVQELKKKSLRPDFVALLDELVQYRNYFAHDFLFEYALLNSLLPEEIASFSKPHRELSKAYFSVEQVNVVFAFFNEQGVLWM